MVILPKKKIKIPTLLKPRISAKPVSSSPEADKEEIISKHISEPVVPETTRNARPSEVGGVKAAPTLFPMEQQSLPEIPLFPLPPISLLDDPPPEKASDDSYIHNNSKKLEQALSEFGIEAKVTSVQKGPVITSYEVEPGVGVKVQSIVSLSDDIALALRAPSIRIVAPIPGKAVMGVEIPNPSPRFVYLKEIMESEEFLKLSSKSKLAIALGKDIRGNPVVDDLKGMPHLLIAGTTGSGKTVFFTFINLFNTFQCLSSRGKVPFSRP